MVFPIARLSTARSLFYLFMKESFLPRTGEFILHIYPAWISVFYTSAYVNLQPHYREEQHVYVTGKNPRHGIAHKLGATSPFILYLQPLQWWMKRKSIEQNLPLPSGVRGGCSAPYSGMQHHPRAVPKQLPCQCKRNKIFQSIICVRNGEMGKIFLPVFMQEVRRYDHNGPFWLQNLWISLCAYWGVSCTCSEPISSLV